MHFLLRFAAATTLVLAFCAAAPAAEPDRSWMTPDLAAAAKAEGGLTVYSSMNEQEGLPLWKLFETATGVPVSYVRASDTQILSRISIEARARQRSWDITVSTAAVKIPTEFVAPVDLPEAANLMPEARGKDKRWHGVYAHYNAPAYHSKVVQPADLPKSLEEFAARKDLKGRVAIDAVDSQWLSGIFLHYGEERGRKLVGEIIQNLEPVLIDGHLQVARAVASGEYLFALTNYVSLTLNMKLSGAATDYFGIDPIPLFFGSVAVNAQAPHPNAARLAANFLLSREAQEFSRQAGRIPVRPDVSPNPPDAVTKLGAHKIVPVVFSAEDEKKWQKTFQEIFRKK